jgi:hypothetical protein
MTRYAMRRRQGIYLSDDRPKRERLDTPGHKVGVLKISFQKKTITDCVWVNKDGKGRLQRFSFSSSERPESGAPGDRQRADGASPLR